MTVRELKQELKFYDEDMAVVFEVVDDFEPESVTEDKWGNRSVHINSAVKACFISECRGDCRIELECDE